MAFLRYVLLSLAGGLCVALLALLLAFTGIALVDAFIYERTGSCDECHLIPVIKKTIAESNGSR